MEKSNFLADLSLGLHEFASRAWLWSIVLQFAIVNASTRARRACGAAPAAKGHYDGAAGWGLIGAPRRRSGSCAAGSCSCVPGRSGCCSWLLGAGAAVPYLFGLAIPLPLVSVLVLAFAAGLGIETFGVLWDTTMQQEIPQDRLSRLPLRRAGLVRASRSAPRSPAHSRKRSVPARR